jgi:hypothetical protein
VRDSSAGIVLGIVSRVTFGHSPSGVSAGSNLPSSAVFGPYSIVTVVSAVVVFWTWTPVKLPKLCAMTSGATSSGAAWSTGVPVYSSSAPGAISNTDAARSPPVEVTLAENGLPGSGLGAEAWSKIAAAPGFTVAVSAAGTSPPGPGPGTL